MYFRKCKRTLIDSFLSFFSETPKKPKEEQERKAVAVARPIQQNCARNCPATAQSTPLLTQQNFAEQPKTILPCKPFENW